MTKYQRGELMEGWNDCPIPVSSTNNSASTSSGASKSRKRMSRMPILGNPPSSGESSTSKSSRTSSMPPLPTSTLSPPIRGSPKATVIESGASENLDFSKSEEKLRKLVAESEIAEKEKDFFTKRLVDAFPSLPEQHQGFVTQIVNQIESNEPKSALKTQILNYMMVNNGVSTWGVPLKKLVESLK